MVDLGCRNASLFAITDTNESTKAFIFDMVRVGGVGCGHVGDGENGVKKEGGEKTQRPD